MVSILLRPFPFCGKTRSGQLASPPHATFAGQRALCVWGEPESPDPLPMQRVQKRPHGFPAHHMCRAGGREKVGKWRRDPTHTQAKCSRQRNSCCAVDPNSLSIQGKVADGAERERSPPCMPPGC